MNVRELTFRGEERTELYACGKCGKLWATAIYLATEEGKQQAAREAAEQCCAPRFCQCGKEIGAYEVSCSPCHELKRLIKAEQITTADYTGPVFYDGVEGGWGEGYSADVQDMLESCDTCDQPHPEYCFPCHPEPLRLDPDSIIENALDGQHEDAGDQIVEADELARFLEAWNEKQTCSSYYPDYKRVIVLDRERFDALLTSREGAAS